MPIYPSTGILMNFFCHFNQLLKTSVPSALSQLCSQKTHSTIFHFTAEANYLCDKTPTSSNKKDATSTLGYAEEKMN